LILLWSRGEALLQAALSQLGIRRLCLRARLRRDIWRYSCLTALFRSLCRLNRGIAANKESQHCAESTADQCEQKGIVQAHRQGMLCRAGLESLHMLTELRDAGGSHGGV
jgi:hypothetical protein